MTPTDVIKERLHVLLEYLLIMQEHDTYKKNELDFFFYLINQMNLEARELLKPKAT